MEKEIDCFGEIVFFENAEDMMAKKFIYHRTKIVDFLCSRVNRSAKVRKFFKSFINEPAIYDALNDLQTMDQKVKEHISLKKVTICFKKVSKKSVRLKNVKIFKNVNNKTLEDKSAYVVSYIKIKKSIIPYLNNLHEIICEKRKLNESEKILRKNILNRQKKEFFDEDKINQLNYLFLNPTNIIKSVEEQYDELIKSDLNSWLKNIK